MNQFVSSLVLICLNSTLEIQFEWRWPSLKVMRSPESLNMCDCSVVKLYEGAQIFVMVDYVCKGDVFKEVL